MRKWKERKEGCSYLLFSSVCFIVLVILLSMFHLLIVSATPVENTPTTVPLPAGAERIATFRLLCSHGLFPPHHINAKTDSQALIPTHVAMSLLCSRSAHCCARFLPGSCQASGVRSQVLVLLIYSVVRCNVCQVVSLN